MVAFSSLFVFALSMTFCFNLANGVGLVGMRIPFALAFGKFGVQPSRYLKLSAPTSCDDCLNGTHVI